MRERDIAMAFIIHRDIPFVSFIISIFFLFAVRMAFIVAMIATNAIDSLINFFFFYYLSSYSSGWLFSQSIFIMHLFYTRLFCTSCLLFRFRSSFRVFCIFICLRLSSVKFDVVRYLNNASRRFYSIRVQQCRTNCILFVFASFYSFRLPLKYVHDDEK